MNGRSVRAYDNVKGQIGFCGIWCGSCAVGNGSLREITREYEKTVEAYGLKEWASKDFDYAEFSQALKSVQRITVCPGCLKGGGREACEIRGCALGRGHSDCTLCDEFGKCEHCEILDKMRSGAVAAGLFAKDTGADNERLVQDWSSQLRRRWPCCILFLESP